jgi:TP53 regulating kinase and related kinases
MKPQIIQQGAEAVLIRKEDVLLKRRVEKGYRISELDGALRKRRTKREGRLLEKAGKIIDVPKVVKVDEKKKEIDMEFIDGLKLSESLDSMKNWKEVCVAIGENIAKLHDEGIIHGDLTTSNMIWKLDSLSLDGKGSLCSQNTAKLRPVSRGGYGSENGGAFVDGDVANGKLFFIDFGLGFANGRIEDKAVDLYLIKEALEAKHFLHWEKFFRAVLEGYKASRSWKETLKRLEKVEKRGRYKEQY